MKRVVSILIILSVLFSLSVGFADDFSVRNGIRFGMTMDEVYQIELVENASGPEKKDYSRYYYDEGSKGISCNNVNVAGYDNADISYSFTADDKLGEFEYSWFYYYDKPEFYDTDSQFTQLKDIYDDINGKLANKYKLISSISGHTYRYIDFNDTNTANFYLPEFDNDDIQYGFSQYLAQDGDNYVEILCRCYKNHLLMSDAFSLNASVQYRSISKELYEQRIKELENAQKKIDDDL